MTRLGYTRLDDFVLVDEVLGGLPGESLLTSAARVCLLPAAPHLVWRTAIEVLRGGPFSPKEKQWRSVARAARWARIFDKDGKTKPMVHPMTIVSIQVILTNGVDLVMCQTNLPTTFPELLPSTKASFSFETAQGFGEEYCRTHFHSIPITVVNTRVA